MYSENFIEPGPALFATALLRQEYLSYNAPEFVYQAHNNASNRFIASIKVAGTI
jgi:hypothetical protein